MTLYTPAFKLGNRALNGYKAFYLNAVFDKQRTWFTTPHHVDVTNTTFSLSRGFGNIATYLAYNISNTGDFYNGNLQAEAYPPGFLYYVFDGKLFVNPYPDYVSFRGFATSRSLIGGLSFTPLYYIQTYLTLRKNNDWPKPIAPSIFDPYYVGRPPYEFDADAPPDLADVCDRGRALVLLQLGWRREVDADLLLPDGAMMRHRQAHFALALLAVAALFPAALFAAPPAPGAPPSPAATMPGSGPAPGLSAAPVTPVPLPSAGATPSAGPNTPHPGPNTPVPSASPAGVLVKFAGQLLDLRGGFVFFTSGDGFQLAPGYQTVDVHTGQPTNRVANTGLYAVASFDPATGAVVRLALSPAPVPAEASYESGCAVRGPGFEAGRQPRTRTR